MAKEVVITTSQGASNNNIPQDKSKWPPGSSKWLRANKKHLVILAVAVTWAAAEVAEEGSHTTFGASF